MSGQRKGQKRQRASSVDKLNDADRAELERALNDRRISIRAIAGRFGLSWSATQRYLHRRKPAPLLVSVEALQMLAWAARSTSGVQLDLVPDPADARRLVPGPTLIALWSARRGDE